MSMIITFGVRAGSMPPLLLVDRSNFQT